MAELTAFKKGDRVIQPLDGFWSTMEYVQYGDSGSGALKIDGGTEGKIIGRGKAGDSWYVDYGDGRHAYVSGGAITLLVREPTQPPLILKPRRKMTLC